jgi:hypothetical protein
VFGSPIWRDIMWRTEGTSGESKEVCVGLSLDCSVFASAPAVRKIEVTPQQLREHRRSFVYGNTHIENPRITREMVAEADRKVERESK